MQILRNIAAARAALPSHASLGLVPTMGALHEGHLALVRAARARCATVVVTIFVNPLQFGPHEDLSRYPRPFERDCALLEAEGVDCVFAPCAEELTPAGEITFVDVPSIAARLEGASRPGHFRGVATVVSKLFHIVQPEFAFFGQKDAEQCAVLRRMVRELNFPVELVICPIVREPDGLAMSSRNVYLNAQERKQALVLHRAMQAMQAAFAAGERNSLALLYAGRAEFAREPNVQMDYLEVVNPDTFESASEATGALIVVAAKVGNTRLLDNAALS